MQPTPDGYLGIDLTGTPKRASTCAYLGPTLASAELADLATDDQRIQPQVFPGHPLDRPQGFGDNATDNDLFGHAACG